MKLYKQEGKSGIYQFMTPALACGKAMMKYLPVSYGDVGVFLKNNYGIVFLNEENMGKVSKAFIKLVKGTFPSGWEKKWEEIDKNLTSFSRKISKLKLDNLGSEELWRLYQEAFKLDQEMWAISIFIDVFDAGFDQIEIEKIARKYGLDIHEIQTLLTPEKQSYVNEWENALYDYKKRKISSKKIIDKFFWYRADYSEFGEVNEEFLKEKAPHAKAVAFKSPIKEQRLILKKHRFSKNPIITFQILANWRDERKRMNFTGLYALVRLLREGLRRQGISPELVNELSHFEAKDVFLGKIKKEKLKERWKEGVFVYIKENGSLDFKTGLEGQNELNKMESMLKIELKDEVKGMIACKGIIRGRVKIILNALNKEEASKLQKGDILVTSMTRPEFVPLMKKAGAIVTNEGGISCHAAIVSRELNIPCIIGTKVATKVFKDNDLVEVDANRGIVKRIK